MDKNKVYDLTWTLSTYESLKNNGDETGELQIFGGNDGIINVTPTPTPTNTPTPTPTSTPTPTPTSTPIPTPTDEPPTPGNGYAYIKKTSTASSDLMDLDGYSLEGGEFTITGDGFTGTFKTNADGTSNQVQLPDNSYSISDSYAADENQAVNVEDAVDEDTDALSDDVEDIDEASSKEDVNTDTNDDNIENDIDAVDVIDNTDEIATQALINPKTTHYVITETKAPTGLRVTEQPRTLTVRMPQDKDKVFEIPFSDAPQVLDARMTIKKLSAKGNPVYGTVFKVEYIDNYNGDMNNVKRTWYLQSDINGIIRFDENHISSLSDYRSDEFFTHNKEVVLPYYGLLRFTEVSTPAEYTLDSTPFIIDLKGAQNGSTVNLSKTVYNDLEPAKIQLTKYSDDKTPLQGVEFELKFVKEAETATNNKQEGFSRLLNVGESVTATTDANGQIAWDNLDQGDYEITEVKTLPGYNLLKDKIKVTLPLQLTQKEADSYGNVNKDAAKEDTNYTKKLFFFDCKYEINDDQIITMPMTGSSGKWVYGFIGFGVIASMGCGFLVCNTKAKKKKKHRRKK